MTVSGLRPVQPWAHPPAPHWRKGEYSFDRHRPYRLRIYRLGSAAGAYGYAGTAAGQPG